MKIIYKSYMARPLKPFGEWNWEVREAVKTAIALVEGKTGSEPFRDMAKV